MDDWENLARYARMVVPLRGMEDSRKQKTNGKLGLK